MAGARHFFRATESLNLVVLRWWPARLALNRTALRDCLPEKKGEANPSEEPGCNLARLTKFASGRSKLDAKGQLSLAREVICTANGTETAGVGVRVRTAEHHAVEGVEELSPELQSDILRNRSPLYQPKVFFVIGKIRIVLLIRRLVAEPVGLARSGRDVRIGIAEGSAVIPEILAGNRGIERLVPACRRLDCLAGNEIPANAVVETRHSGCTAESYGLTALVALNAAQGPPSDEVVQCMVTVQEVLAFSE